MYHNRIDYTLVAGDYNSLEARVAGFVSRDPRLMAISNATGWAGDIHSQNTFHIYGIKEEEQVAHPDIRTRAKVDFFASLYGGGAKQVLRQIERTALERPELGITIPTERDTQRRLDALYDEYKVFFREHVPLVIERARERGGVIYTAFGRPRLVPALFSPIKEEREGAEREVVSHEVQGTAADLARFATNRVGAIREDWGKLLLQIHDELLARVSQAHLEPYVKAMEEGMLLGQPLEGVPLVVKIKSGPTWKDCHR